MCLETNPWCMLVKFSCTIHEQLVNFSDQEEGNITSRVKDTIVEEASKSNGKFKTAGVQINTECVTTSPKIIKGLEIIQL